MARKVLNTSPIPQGTDGAMLSSVGAPVTDQERSSMLAQAGLDQSYYSTSAPWWSYVVAVGMVGMSLIASKRIANSGSR